MAAELGRTGGQLLRLLGRTIKIESMKRAVPVTRDREPWRQGYRLAESARRACHPPTGPIPELWQLMEELGVHVTRVGFANSSLEAASLWEPGAMPIVLVNSACHSMDRVLPRRAGLAHELCHLLHDSGERDVTTRLSWDESGHGGEVEQRARAFGPAFLAPPSDVKLWFRSGPGRRVRQAEARVTELAKRWGLSYFGAIWHAKNCGLIRTRTAHDLADAPDEREQPWALEFETTSTNGPAPVMVRGEEFTPSPLTTGLVGELALDAVEVGAISAGRAVEILNWGRDL